MKIMNNFKIFFVLFKHIRECKLYASINKCLNFSHFSLIWKIENNLARKKWHFGSKINPTPSIKNISQRDLTLRKN